MFIYVQSEGNCPKYDDQVSETMRQSLFKIDRNMESTTQLEINCPEFFRRKLGQCVRN